MNIHGIYSAKSRADKEVRDELRRLLGVRKLAHVVSLLTEDFCTCGSVRLLELTARSKSDFEVVKYGICRKCGR